MSLFHNTVSRRGLLVGGSLATAGLIAAPIVKPNACCAAELPYLSRGISAMTNRS
jgi:hypothetical protein